MDTLVMAGVYLAALGFLWGALWLLVASIPLGDLPRVRRGFAAARSLLAPWPLVWLLAYGSLLTRAYLAAGEWPRSAFSFAGGWHGNVRAGEFPLHVAALDVLGVAALVAVLLFPPLHAVLRANPSPRPRALLALFALPFTLLLWLACTEGPANALNWLAYTR